MSHPLVQNLQDIVFTKPEELGSWNFRECSPPIMCHMSGVTCHVSGVTRQVSCVRCNMSGVMRISSSSSFLQNGGASRWKVCYQWGLPSFFFFKSGYNNFYYPFFFCFVIWFCWENSVKLRCVLSFVTIRFFFGLSPWVLS